MSALTPKKLYALDKTAVAELIERYRAPLLFFVMGFLGDVTEAEDAVSDTIVKLLLKKPLLRNEAALKTYLYKTAEHIAVDQLRKRKREKRYLQSELRLAETPLDYADEQMGKSSIPQRRNGNRFVCLRRGKTRQI
jgi:RNA polymerase sigma-70 factor (ECF subfamily)